MKYKAGFSPSKPKLPKRKLHPYENLSPAPKQNNKHLYRPQVKAAKPAKPVFTLDDSVIRQGNKSFLKKQRNILREKTSNKLNVNLGKKFSLSREQTASEDIGEQTFRAFRASQF